MQTPRKSPDREPVALKTTPEHAAELIGGLQSRGAELLETAKRVASAPEYKTWEGDFHRWRDVVKDALRTLYTSEAPIDEFGSAASEPLVISSSTGQEFEWQQEAIGKGINKLESLKERLQYVPQVETVGRAGEGGATLRSAPAEDAKVFVVHGRNEEVKTSVARLLERTGPTHAVVILHEQADQGRTIIEKFEDHATQADHAIVLMTGDDVGGLRITSGDPELQPRARQNVILELGYFAGHLGRSRVTVLHEPAVEIPSDYLGVVYVQLDEGGGWKYRLLNELKAAGFTYDLNAVA